MICDFIMKGNNLEELHLSNNEIDNEGAQHLIKVLSGKNRFSVIDIDNNKISGESLMQLFNIMPLRNLNLIKNVLEDQ